MKLSRPTMAFLASFAILTSVITAGVWSDQRAPVFAAGQTTIYLPMVNNGPPWVNPFGVVMYEGVSASSGLAEMRAAGSRRVTVILDWAAVEPSEGVRNWAAFDTTVANARAAGMEILTLFVGDPSWAWTPSRDATVAEKRINFVRAMVDRYDCDGANDAGPNLCVHDWSFYAEPDADYGPNATPGSKGWWGGRPEQFAEMLASVSGVVHSENSGAKVLIGGLAYDWFAEDTEGGLFRRSFLPRVLQTLNRSYGGAAQVIDQVAIHFYPLMFAGVREKVQEVRTIMRQHGVGHLPIVIPEGGYWSDAENGSNLEHHAAMLVRIYVEALSVDVEYVTWHLVFDLPGETRKWGLFHDQDVTRPKPAYWAYATMAQELAHARFARMVDQPGLGGAVFSMPNGQQKTVVWPTGSGGQFVFGSSCARVVTVTGTVYARILDGQVGWDQDGRVNGSIRLRGSADQPIYVGACS